MSRKPPYSLSVLILRNKEYHKKRVSIEQEIDDYRKQHPGKKPLILIDLMLLDKIPTGDREESNKRNICGADLNRLSALEAVLRFLRDHCQAELVCFIDGPDSRDNYEDTFDAFKPDRKNERYDNDIKTIEAMKRGEYHGQWHAPTDRILFTSIKTLARRYGTLWHSLKNTRKLEMSRYAVEHGALAVLSTSSDYLLYVDTIPLKLWHLTELRVDSMTVLQFDHQSVCRLATAEKRRLLAALLPGSVMGPHAFGEDVPKICQLVRQIPGKVTKEVYCDVARRLFGDEEKADALQKACEVIYDPAKIELSIQEEQSEMMNYSYDILHNRTSTFTLMLNDLRYWESQNVDLYQLVVSSYGRMAGLVLKQNGQPYEPDAVRRMRIKRNHVEPFAYHMVRVIYPEFEVNASSATVTDTISDLSLECLKFVLELENLPMDRVRLLVEDNELKLLDYITVYYMVQKNLIGSDMADVILVAVEQHSNNADQRLNRIPPSYDMEAFHATFMYVRWRFWIGSVLNICGFPSAFIDNETRLDGVRMQNLYQLFLTSPQLLQEYSIDVVRGRRLHN